MSNHPDIQEISPDVAAKTALHAMLSSNSYHEDDRVRFPVEKLGWIQVDLEGNPTTEPTRLHSLSGLAFDIFEKRETDDVVFAFRGTDGGSDFLFANFAVPPLNLQYTQARKEFHKYWTANKNKNIAVTGHSLGGGLALSISVHFGIAAITFDSSPRIFDGFGDRHAPAERVVIYEDGEVLEPVRRHWKKIAEVVPRGNFYRCSFDFPGSQHRIDLLAQRLLALGAQVNPELDPVRNALAA